tara:strand:- start:238 stop:459 length:222 start_codon:yes stop_codon:yes gene_type:complete
MYRLLIIAFLINRKDFEKIFNLGDCKTKTINQKYYLSPPDLYRLNESIPANKTKDIPKSQEFKPYPMNYRFFA